ncbi:DUF3397 domain-containing protein [Enterococcus sp. BWT-B8]|uniref:DUF3397 domain-containing protein n=1 Tax=unclassified Enterococcus TaxID=2608891 RepID=UPI001E49259E|nr:MULTISPECIES: DUF3397 domain-containing protein [unclassified Enterococcus]MCB5953143.1 DUF3397 domain-containing protein [Enterococcus sp. BWT-B8]MCB5956171.1 DUF3397 domain-containing protein [Enterococcus sp. CWB-B31]
MVSFSIIMLLWYVFPVAALFASSILITRLSLAERYKVKAPDIATPFLLIGMHVLSKDTYNQSIIPYMFISILLLGICVALFQAYYYGELIYGRYFKMFWRLNFLLVLVVYALLVLSNISHYLF